MRYRLRQVDFDGQFEYSPVISVRADGDGTAALLISPNPVLDEATVRILAPDAGPAELRLFDAAGRTVWQGTLDLRKGPNETPAPLHDLPPGTYWLQLTTAARSWQAVVVKG